MTRFMRNGWRRSRVTFALAFLFLAFPAWSSLAEPRESVTLRLEIEAPDTLMPAARRLNAINAQRLSHVYEFTGSPPLASPIRVVLAAEDSPFARPAPDWASGYAVGQENLIVIFPARVLSYPYDSLEEVLVHEVVHILVAHAAQGRPVPRWFDEGLATTAADDWGVEDRMRLLWATLAQPHVSLAQIDLLFRQDAASARRAYVLAGAFVQDLLKTYGRQVPRRILTGVRDGIPFPEAFARVTMVTLEGAEASFWRRETRWTRWIPVLTSSAVLWAGITMLVFYAYRRQRKRAALIRRRWEHEEDEEIV